MAIKLSDDKELVEEIRQKLKESGKNIKTIRNVGYVLQRVNSNETEN